MPFAILPMVPRCRTAHEASDFSKRRIRTITVEHNHTSARDAIHDVLCRKGFVRKMESISAFDDWYVEAR